jgi:Condensation domain
MSILEQAMRDEVLVSFDGPQTDTGPLTWGQEAIWHDMRASGQSLSVAGAHNLPDGTTVEDVAAQLASLVGRYPALRMRLDTDARGSTCQVVHASGEAALDVVSIPADVSNHDAVACALEVMHDGQVAPFDPYRDWPLQLALIRRGDALLFRVCVVSHLAVDGLALELLFADLDSASAPGREASGPGAVDLLDLARRERTEPLRRISNRAMRYWESQLRSAPPLTFGEPAHPEGRRGHRYWHGHFDSPAAYLAMLAIAQRTRTDTSRVLHAIIATAIGRATGISPLTVKINVSNRFRPGYAKIIAPLSQKSVVTLDVADTSLDEVIARVRRAMPAAGMYGYYDPQQLDLLCAQVAAERGEPARITCMINDAREAAARQAAEGAARAPVTTKQIAEKRQASVLAWDGTLDNFHDQAWITIFDYPETIWVQVIFDMACFTEEQAEALLRGVEEVAVAAAFDASAPTRVGRQR